MGRPNENQGCGCLIALVALIAFAVYSWHRWTLVAPFRDHIAAYASVSGPRAAGGPYVTGKVVVVDQANARMDNLFFELPDGLRATRPEEVGTVVRVHWG